MPDPQPSPPESPPALAAPPAPNPAAEHAEAQAALRGQTRAALGALQDEVQKDYDDFLFFIEEENIDFAANRANQIITEAPEGLKSFLQENQSDAPEQFQKAWRNALIEFVKSEMRSADEPLSDIKVEEANEIVRKMRDPNSGVGPFEQWFQKKYPAEYKAWKEAKAEAERKRQEAEQAAREAAERQRQAQETQQQQQEQAALEASEEADMPFLDRINKTVAGMEEGKWKTVATKLVAALTGLFVMLSKAPLIGGWVRRNFISNRTLAQLGDKTAEVAVRVEEQFRKLGLSHDLANELGGKKTKEVIVLIKDPQKLTDLTTDTAAQGKLNQLADQLTAKNGATSEVTLFEFMGNNPNWPGVAVAGGIAAAPATAPAAAPSAAPPAPTAVETMQQKLDAVFSGMTPDDRLALENAKTKEAAAGNLPDPIKSNERATKIAVKLKANGADQITDPNRTVKQFIEANLDKDWTIA